MPQTSATKVTAAQNEPPDLWRNWFDDSPVPMAIEDWSKAKQIVDRLRNSSIENSDEYIGEHPEILAELAPAAKVLDANAALIGVYNASSKQDLAAMNSAC